MEDFNTSFTIGHHDPKRPRPVTVEVLEQAHSAGYNIVTTPITNAHFHSRVLTQLSNFLAESSTRNNGNVTSTYHASPVHISSLSPEDTPLAPDETISQIIAVTSPWIDLCSPDPVIADISRQVLQLEIEYAAFCGVLYIMIHGPRLRKAGAGETAVSQYARAVLDALTQGPHIQYFIWLPMVHDPKQREEQMGDLAPFARAQYVEDDELDPHIVDSFGSWEAWDIVRSTCRYSTRLCVSLALPRLLPSAVVQSRWFSEPVRVFTLDASAFTQNAKGYPVLAKAQQALITRFVHFKQPPVWFLLCNVGPIAVSNGTELATNDPEAFPTPAESSKTTYLKDPTPHLSYMRNLQNKQPNQSAADRYGSGYQDYLQMPLRPLTTHLESINYEVFERDPVKYEWYERATARALHDWIEQEKPTSNPDGRVVVAVVGAGRGPLVTRAIQAAEAVGVDIDIWALEKNPNAFVLLQRTNRETWNNRVRLVKSDMRTWRGPSRLASSTPISKTFNVAGDDSPDEQAQTEQDPSHATSNGNTDLASNQSHSIYHKIDIVISELLGSFGDNELSPECLDGVQHLLNPIHGISIPASYNAFLTPVAAPKLHADISLSMSSSFENASETPYVVMLNAIDFLSTREGSATAPKSLLRGTEEQAEISSEPDAKARSNENRGRRASASAHLIPPTGSAPPNAVILETWSFHHPNPHLPVVPTSSSTATSAASNAHNARYCSLTFPIPHRCTCHGLAGYFETVLYPGVELSINPLTMEDKSNEMISWFPIYFPLKTPLYIPDKANVTVQMWRRTDDRKVWYEWIVEVFTVIAESQKDSQTGQTRRRERKVKIAASALHSNEKEACLM